MNVKPSAIITFEHVAHSYIAARGRSAMPEVTCVFEDFSLSIAASQLTALTGPSGCGKSTLLRLIAGLEGPSSGKITVNGGAPEPGKNGVAFVFQQHALFPWMKVIDNVTFGMKEGRSEDRHDKAMAYLARMGLADAARRMPFELSGGMQQRVSIARALACEPRILLMDEPFSALDERLRRDLQDELLQLRQEMNLTIVYVTHSIDEAIYLGDRSVVVSHKPAIAAADLSITLPHPRNRHDEDFEQQVLLLRRHLMDL